MPWLTMCCLLSGNGIQVEGWPFGCPLPGETIESESKETKGVESLTVSQLSILKEALLDISGGITFRKITNPADLQRMSSPYCIHVYKLTITSRYERWKISCSRHLAVPNVAALQSLAYGEWCIDEGPASTGQPALTVSGRRARWFPVKFRVGRHVTGSHYPATSYKVKEGCCKNQGRRGGRLGDDEAGREETCTLGHGPVIQ